MLQKHLYTNLVHQITVQNICITGEFIIFYAFWVKNIKKNFRSILNVLSMLFLWRVFSWIGSDYEKIMKFLLKLLNFLNGKLELHVLVSLLYDLILYSVCKRILIKGPRASNLFPVKKRYLRSDQVSNESMQEDGTLLHLFFTSSHVLGP